MEDNNTFINVDREYLEEIQKKAEGCEWQRGYIQGVEDGIKYAVMILQQKEGE